MTAIKGWLHLPLKKKRRITKFTRITKITKNTRTVKITKITRIVKITKITSIATSTSTPLPGSVILIPGDRGDTSIINLPSFPINHFSL